MTEPLTTAEKKILHACPTCSHLLANHDSAGWCVACSAVDEDDQCRETPRVIETTFELDDSVDLYCEGCVRAGLGVFL